VSLVKIVVFQRKAEFEDKRIGNGKTPPAFFSIGCRHPTISRGKTALHYFFVLLFAFSCYHCALAEYLFTDFRIRYAIFFFEWKISPQV
jgi:hypothetical protein